MKVQKNEKCTRCPYYTHKFVPPEGPTDADVLIVGENPGRNECREGKPFIGDSGIILNQVLDTVGLDRKSLYVTNAVKCGRAENESETNPEAIEHCRANFLTQEIIKVKPKIIVPMGNVALQGVLDKKGITKARGLLSVTEFKHKKEKHKAKVLPTYHPAHILRQRWLQDIMVADMKVVAFQSTSTKVLTPKQGTYVPVTESWENLKKFCKNISKKKSFSWDLETTGLHPEHDFIMDMSFSAAAYEAWTVHLMLNHDSPAQAKIDGRRGLRPRREFMIPNPIFTPKRMKWFAQWCYDILHSGKRVIFQNSKFDLRMLRSWFLRILDCDLDIQRINWVDILPMAQLWNENLPKNLKDLARMHTNIVYTKEEIEAVKGGVIMHVPWEKRAIYAGKDADATFRLFDIYKKLLATRPALLKLLWEREIPDMKYLLMSELYGMQVDLDKRKTIGKHLLSEMRISKKTMWEIAEQKFNPRSPQQLAKVMFKDLRIPFNPETVKEKSKNPSTDKKHVEWLLENLDEDSDHHKFVQALSDFRSNDKLYGTFVKNIKDYLDENDRLHTDFLLWGTVSGRFSAKEPNVLNIPRDRDVSIRDMFVARPGYKLIDADFSQIEFKLMALISGEQNIINQLLAGDDFHSITARTLFPKLMRKGETIIKTGEWKGEKLSTDAIDKWKKKVKDARQIAKRFNFALVYGAGERSLAGQIRDKEKGETLEEALERVKGFKEQHRQAFPKLWFYIDRTPKIALEDGELELPNGRVRRFPKVFDKAMRMYQERQAGNFQAQGQAAYICRAAYARICHRFLEEGIDGFPINVVYDAIIAEVADKDVNRALRIMIEEMLKPVEDADNFVFTVEAGIGQSWHDAERSSYPIKNLSDIQHWKAA